MAVASGDPVEIYRACGPTEAHALRIALEQEGISAFVDNETLQDGVGGLVAGWATASRILVAPSDEVAARVVVDKFVQRVSGPAAADAPLRCLACGVLMAEADACEACGWSYSVGPDTPADPNEDAPIADRTADKDEPAGQRPEQSRLPDPQDTVASPALARRTVWGEVGAVAAVGVVPNLVHSVHFLAVPAAPQPPYWFSALELTTLSGCTIFVVLYLIHRSEEAWSRFGLTRLGRSDVLLGVGLSLVSQVIAALCSDLVPSDGWAPDGSPFPRPRQPADYGLMVLMHGANGFAEELVTRAYLVTRFEQLLRSRGAAVLLSAAMFAAYHSYQGAAGVTNAMAIGVTYGAAFLLFRRIWPLAIGHAVYNICLELAV